MSGVEGCVWIASLFAAPTICDNEPKLVDPVIPVMVPVPPVLRILPELGRVAPFVDCTCIPLIVIWSVLFVPLTE